jgi:hypothetical protein
MDTADHLVFDHAGYFVGLAALDPQTGLVVMDRSCAQRLQTMTRLACRCPPGHDQHAGCDEVLADIGRRKIPRRQGWAQQTWTDVVPLPYRPSLDGFVARLTVLGEEWMIWLRR